MKVTVGSNTRSTFQAATDRGTAADITVTTSSVGTAVSQAYGQANAAYAEANLKLNIAGGTITGSLVVNGNLEVLGNTTFLNVDSLVIEDNEIVLNGNTSAAPLLNAFITIDRGTSSNVSLKWNEDIDKWQWTDDGATYYSLDTSLNAYAQANLASGNSEAAYNQANSARDQANTARTVGNNAYGQANTAFTYAGLAYNQANAARDQANTARTVGNNAYAQANSNYQPAVTRLDVTNNGSSAYRFDQYGTTDDPTLYIRAGETLAFNLNNAGHPFTIRVSNGGMNYSTGLTHVATDGTVTTGSSAQAKISGTLYWKVPFELGGNTYVYQCTAHAAMVGNIVIEPPIVQVLAIANAAYGQANVASNQANNAYAQANAAYADSNTRVLKAGDTMTGNLNVAATLITRNVIPSENVTYSLGTPELRFKDLYLANSTLYIGDTIISGETGEVRSQTFNASVSFINGGLNVLDQANTARNTANDAYAQANSARTTANDAYNLANSIYTVANDAYTQANTARLQANTARDTANDAYGQANTARLQANTARDTANGAYEQANGAYSQANGAYTQANGAYQQANGAYAQANGAYSQANGAYAQANVAYSQANAAYDRANTKVSKSGDNMTGTLTITNGDLNVVNGNIYLSGNTTYVNVATLQIEDSLLYLASNNKLTDIVDIGLVGGKNTAGVFSHTGLARHASDGTWYLFDNLADSGHENNIIDVANTTYAMLRANIEAQSINVGGTPVANTNHSNAAYGQANAARDQANTARDTANGAYGQANGAYSQANGAYSQANGAYAQANGAYSQANGAYAQANSGFAQANGAYAQANIAANTVRVYTNSASELSNKFLNFVNTASIQVTVVDNLDGNANIAFSTTGAAVSDAYGQANAARDAANGAYSQANGAYGQANGAYGQANGAYSQANGAYSQANLSYAQANTARDIANGAYAQANGAYSQANGAYSQANGAYAHANIIYGLANSSYDQANSARDQANTARNTANDSYGQANTARDQANTARNTANGAYAQANGAYAQANGAYGQANGAYAQANTGIATANGAYAQANGAYSQANGAYAQANTAYGQANDAYSQANTARNVANTAYGAANSAANTTAVSANSSGTLAAKQINFVNTSTITVSVTQHGGFPGQANVTLSANVSAGQEYQYNTSTTSAEVVDSWSASAYRSGKYHMQVENFNGFLVTEIMIIHDAANTNLVKYGTSSLGGNTGSFTSDMSGGLVRLLFTPTDATSQLTYNRVLLTSRNSESLPGDLMTGTDSYDLMNELTISPTDLNA